MRAYTLVHVMKNTGDPSDYFHFILIPSASIDNQTKDFFDKWQRRCLDTSDMADGPEKSLALKFEALTVDVQGARVFSGWNDRCTLDTDETIDAFYRISFV